MALYDPNEFPQEVETTKDFTLADVLAWARTKPADERYSYCNADNCAVAQFGRETGRPHLIDIGFLALEDWDLNEAAQGDGDASTWTFGAFADRLEKALA